MKNKEVYHLLISWLTISMAFAWATSRFDLSAIASTLPVMLIAVGTGFIFHELSHKYVAIHYGAHAEYRAWTIGLVLALAFSFMGFVFAAPGAVYIYGPHINRDQNGKISLAGPLMNIVIGALSFFMLINGFYPEIVSLVMYVNLFLAAFNLIPVFPLDGSKVFAWNKAVWGVLFFPLIAVLFFIF